MGNTDWFEEGLKPIEERIKKALGGLVELYAFEVDGEMVKLWHRREGAGISSVLIDIFSEQGFKISLILMRDKNPCVWFVPKDWRI